MRCTPPNHNMRKIEISLKDKNMPLRYACIKCYAIKKRKYEINKHPSERELMTSSMKEAELQCFKFHCMISNRGKF